SPPAPRVIVRVPEIGIAGAGPAYLVRHPYIGVTGVDDLEIVIVRELARRVISSVNFLPDYGGEKIPASEHLIHYDLEVVPLVVIDGHPDRAIFGQEIAKQFQPW